MPTRLALILSATLSPITRETLALKNSANGSQQRTKLHLGGCFSGETEENEGKGREEKTGKNDNVIVEGRLALEIQIKSNVGVDLHTALVLDPRENSSGGQQNPLWALLVVV